MRSDQARARGGNSHASSRSEQIPASKRARIALAIMAAAAFAAIVLPGPPSGSSSGLLRIYLTALALLGILLNGAVVICFGLLGASTLWTSSFPPPGLGLPWPTRRVFGWSARIFGLFCLFVVLLTIERLWANAQQLWFALSL
jgi:hypothetical protein